MKYPGWLSLEIAALAFLAAGGAILRSQETHSGPWVMQSSGTTAGLRGIHAVGGGVAWASGTDGTVLRTEDGGYLWQRCAMPPGAGKLDFRGIWAWDENTALVMSSGPGDLSRLYKTTDGCSHWKLLYTNPDKNGFWDAMVFWDKEHGFLLGDPVHRTPMKTSSDPRKELSFSSPRFLTLQTNDSGKTWAYWPAYRGSNLEAGSEGAGAFAASNSAIFFPPQSVKADGKAVSVNPAWIGIGGKSGSFVYLGRDMSVHSPELGFGWSDKILVPLASGRESTGVFSIAFRLDIHSNATSDGANKFYQHGIAVGGDYTKPSESAGTAAWTADGGRHWTAAEKPPHGYRSAVAWDADAKAWIAVGTNGSDISYDDGKTWAPLDIGNWNALSLPWVVGPQGRIAKLDAEKLAQK